MVRHAADRPVEPAFERAPTVASPEAGDLLAPGSSVGSFVIERVLARDDVGATYLATSSGAFEVVVEEYFPVALAQRGIDGQVQLRSAVDAARFDAGLRAFIDEADLFSRLNQAALLRLGPAWETRGTAYRPCFGRREPTLAAWLAARDEPPDEAWVRQLLGALLDALEAVHDAGWVHGQVRPGNIAIAADGLPTLLDAGAARAVLGAVQPEPGYRAPEQGDPRPGVEVLASADLYALAAVAYRCLGGDASRGGALPEAGASASLRNVLDQALAFDARQRPPTAAAMRAALENTGVAAVALPAAAVFRYTAPAAAVQPSTSSLEAYPHRPEPAFDADDGVSPPIEAGPASAAAVDTPARVRRWPWLLGGLLVGAVLASVLMSHPVGLIDRLRSTVVDGGVTTQGPGSNGRPGVEPSVEPGVPAAAAASALAPPVPLRSAEPPAVADPPAVAEAATGVAVPSDAAPPQPASEAELGVTAAPETAAPPQAPTPAASTPDVERPVAAPPAPRPARAVTSAAPATPRAVCGARSNFSLVWCMRQQCARALYVNDPQCVRFRLTDEVP